MDNLILGGAFALERFTSTCIDVLQGMGFTHSATVKPTSRRTAKNDELVATVFGGESQAWLTMDSLPSAARVVAIRLAAALNDHVGLFAITITGDFECHLEHTLIDAAGTVKEGTLASKLEADAGGDWRTLCDSKSYFLHQSLLDAALTELTSDPMHTVKTALHFKRPAPTGDARLDALIAQVKGAEAAEFREMAGRRCVRLLQADGSKSTVFLNEAEETAIRAVLEA